MSEREKKYFICHPCRFAWETTEYVNRGDAFSAVCPVCDRADGVKETVWRTLNIMRGWDSATGPRTEEGKARTRLNGWKDGRYAQPVLMAPAKPGKYPTCENCALFQECKSKPYKFCPADLETFARFIQAFKEGDVNDLRELAGLAQAQTFKIFQQMIYRLLKDGVVTEVKRPVLDGEGNPILDENGKPIFNIEYAKNNLIKDIPSFLDKMGFSAELQDMTPKTRQESETLKGFVDDKKASQEDEIAVRRAAVEEMKRMTEAVKNMGAIDKLKRMNGDE